MTVDRRLIYSRVINTINLHARSDARTGGASVGFDEEGAVSYIR